MGLNDRKNGPQPADSSRFPGDLSPGLFVQLGSGGVFGFRILSE